MPHINLLPWREQQRKESQNKFVTVLFAVVVISFLSMYILSSFYSGLREGQNIKNDFLNTEIALLNQRIREINDSDKKKKAFNNACDSLKSYKVVVTLVRRLWMKWQK